jgi:hypothetical protein
MFYEDIRKEYVVSVKEAVEGVIRLKQPQIKPVNIEFTGFNCGERGTTIYQIPKCKPFNTLFK